jgi:hypothetical protein
MMGASCIVTAFTIAAVEASFSLFLTSALRCIMREYMACTTAVSGAVSGWLTEFTTSSVLGLSIFHFPFVDAF